MADEEKPTAITAEEAPAPAAEPEIQEEDDPALIRMHSIVDKFLARPDSGPFREPVDWRGLELFDYPVLITHPMDLGTIKRKLERREYPNAATCAYDVKLVWKNCQTYNSTGSDFWLLAKSYARRFEDLYRKVRQECEVGEEPGSPAPSKSSDRRKSKTRDRDTDGDDEENDESPEDEEEAEDSDEEMEDAAEANSEAAGDEKSAAPSSELDEKARLAANILLLNGSHLGKVVRMLQEKCPEALEPWNHNDRQMEISIDKLYDTNAQLFQTISDLCSKNAMPLRGAPMIEESIRRMRADPADLVQPHVLQDEKGSNRGRPRSDARNIMQIDVSTGHVANVYTSLTSAAQAMGCSRHIVAGILRGTYKSKSYQGWTFKYDGVDAGFAVQEYDDEDDENGGGDESKKKRRKSKATSTAQSPRAISVQEIDAATGKVVRVHQSLTKAARASGANRHVICRVLAGEIPSWQGLRWKYSEGEDAVEGST